MEKEKFFDANYEETTTLDEGFEATIEIHTNCKEDFEMVKKFVDHQVDIINAERIKRAHGYTE